MRSMILMAPCLLVSACGPQLTASTEELRAALPSSESLSMPLVAVQAPQPAPGMCPSSAASIFGTLTHQVAGNVDGVLSDVFGVVGQITAQPPSARDAGQAMWGPMVGASSEYMLAVQKVGASDFKFFLGGEPKGAADAWQGVFGGNTTIVDAQHRSGEVDINFTVMHSLDAAVDPVAGGAAIQFAIDGDARNVTAHFGGIVSKKGGPPQDADYAFSLAADRTVGFAYVTHFDFDGDGKLDELVRIESRWAADGRGTAHVTVTGGSLARSVNAVECWDGALGRVYYSDDQGGGVVGAMGCCPF